jgi:prolyl-tRNA synthetase
VVLRMSTLFLRTLREDPADAEVPSHRLLVRAGYVRRAAAGIYSWLPLGKIVLDNAARIVREEMDAMGAQEVLLPALLPREPYETTGRWDDYGADLFRLRDRRGGDYLLGPTHEELMTLLVKGEYSSYKDLPLSLYQVQTKYRDEPRPRSGVIRGREFVMKDSYSFDLDDASLQASYDAHRAAYRRIFTRLGLDFVIVSAVAGAMGGSHSEEFLAPSPVGEDAFVSCPSCDYAANVEAATAGDHPAGETPVPGSDAPAMEELHTPGVPGIAEVVAHLGGGMRESDMLKTILAKDAGGQVYAALVPGDREVDVERLAAATGAEGLELFDDDDFAARSDLVRGYAGPQGMQGRGVLVVADGRVARGTAWVTGANRADSHVRYAVAGRDFDADVVADIATVSAGDPCPRCGSPLQIGRAIECGHVFQLGQKYTRALELQVSGPDGDRVTPTMGSYGIGVSRVLAAVVEQTHDDKGLAWPLALAPADVHVVAVGKGGQLDAAVSLAEDLQAAGLRVLLDDRGASAGVAFKDAELLGLPYAVVVGKALADGEVEVRDRRAGTSERVALAGAVAAVGSLVGAERASVRSALDALA